MLWQTIAPNPLSTYQLACHLRQHTPSPITTKQQLTGTQDTTPLQSDLASTKCHNLNQNPTTA
jgi:hypothetical protein